MYQKELQTRVAISSWEEQSGLFALGTIAVNVDALAVVGLGKTGTTGVLIPSGLPVALPERAVPPGG